MKFGSLFSGIGGFDLAFENAGMECVWQCEIDPHAQKILKRHFPGAKLYDDVRTITKHNAEPVDLICGGFPCQDLSIAGKRAGLAGERSGLWHEFARVIDEFEPAWVVIENVPGLLSSNKGADFAVILRWLVERGYGVCWRILDSQNFGLAQRRKRVFIVASYRNGRAAEILFESEGMSGDTTPSKEKREGIAGTLDAKSSSSNRGSQANETEFIVGIDHELNTAVELVGTLNRSGDASDAGINVTAYENHPNDSRITETGEISQQLTSRMGTGGGNVPLVQYWDGGQVADTLDVSSLVKQQSMPDKRRFPALISSGVRRLTPTECERLQGFPDGWTDGQVDSHRYKQLGNAVSVPVAEWLARRLTAC